MPDPGDTDDEITVGQLRREAAAYDRGRADGLDEAIEAVRGARDGRDAEARIRAVIERDETRERAS